MSWEGEPGPTGAMGSSFKDVIDECLREAGGGDAQWNVRFRLALKERGLEISVPEFTAPEPVDGPDAWTMPSYIVCSSPCMGETGAVGPIGPIGEPGPKGPPGNGWPPWMNVMLSECLGHLLAIESSTSGSDPIGPHGPGTDRQLMDAIKASVNRLDSQIG